MLNGGLLVQLQLDNESKVDDIKAVLEKAVSLTPSFKAIKQISICGECGYKDEKLEEKCPKCKSLYIIRNS